MLLTEQGDIADTQTRYDESNRTGFERIGVITVNDVAVKIR